MATTKSKTPIKTTLQAVVSKIKQLGAEEYDGKIYENILSIFNTLTTTEKRTLLRGLINICFIVEDRVLVDKEALTELKDTIDSTKQKMVNSKTDIEEFNKKELIKLKSWLVKVVSTIVLIFLGLSFLLVIFLKDDASSSFHIFKTLSDIFGVIFGDGKE